jgi:ABC-type amino acid transport substrate-binding protein
MWRLRSNHLLPFDSAFGVIGRNTSYLLGNIADMQKTKSRPFARQGGTHYTCCMRAKNTGFSDHNTCPGWLSTLIASALLVSCIVLPASAAESPPVDVVVASESWGKLMYADAHGVARGPVADFINRMNAVQNKFVFHCIVLPRLRLNLFFREKKADVYPLRTMLWAPDLNLLPTKTILTSGAVYFARKDNPYNGSRVFDNLKDRTLAGGRGYHYQIFNNNPDETYIAAQGYKAHFLDSNEAVIDFVLAGRADVGILAESVLAQYFKDPAMRDKLIVDTSKRDSLVQLSNLVRKDGPISVDEMNAITELMFKSGDVAKLSDEMSLGR